MPNDRVLHDSPMKNGQTMTQLAEKLAWHLGILVRTSQRHGNLRLDATSFDLVTRSHQVGGVLTQLLPHFTSTSKSWTRQAWMCLWLWSHQIESNNWPQKARSSTFWSNRQFFCHNSTEIPCTRGLLGFGSSTFNRWIILKKHPVIANATFWGWIWLDVEHAHTEIGAANTTHGKKTKKTIEASADSKLKDFPVDLELESAGFFDGKLAMFSCYGMVWHYYIWVMCDEYCENLRRISYLIIIVYCSSDLNKNKKIFKAKLRGVPSATSERHCYCGFPLKHATAGKLDLDRVHIDHVWFILNDQPTHLKTILDLSIAICPWRQLYHGPFQTRNHWPRPQMIPKRKARGRRFGRSHLQCILRSQPWARDLQIPDKSAKNCAVWNNLAKTCKNGNPSSFNVHHPSTNLSAIQSFYGTRCKSGRWRDKAWWTDSFLYVLGVFLKPSW